MMDVLGSVWFNAALSGVLAALLVIAVTLLIEKFGGIIGGIIAGAPTLIILASIGFARQALQRATSDDGSIDLQRAQDEYHHNMFVIPCGFLINSLFIFLWRFLPPRLPKQIRGRDLNLHAKLGIMIATTISFWLVCSLAFGTFTRLFLEVHSVGTTMAFGATAAIVMLMVGIFSTHELRESVSPSQQQQQQQHTDEENEIGTAAAAATTALVTHDDLKKQKAVRWYVILARGVLAFSIAAVSILLSKLNVWLAGLLSTFPTLFITSMVALWVSQGEEVPAAAAGPMMLGMLAIPVYAMTASFTLLSRGILVGVLISFAVAVGTVSIPAYIYLRFRESKTTANNGKDIRCQRHSDQYIQLEEQRLKASEHGFIEPENTTASPNMPLQRARLNESEAIVSLHAHESTSASSIQAATSEAIDADEQEQQTIYDHHNRGDHTIIDHEEWYSLQKQQPPQNQAQIQIAVHIDVQLLQEASEYPQQHMQEEDITIATTTLPDESNTDALSTLNPFVNEVKLQALQYQLHHQQPEYKEHKGYLQEQQQQQQTTLGSDFYSNEESERGIDTPSEYQYEDKSDLFDKQHQQQQQQQQLGKEVLTPTAAAIRLQSFFRGALARIAYEKRRREFYTALEQHIAAEAAMEQQHMAATKIQAIFRGRAARARFSGQYNTTQQYPAATTATPNY